MKDIFITNIDIKSVRHLKDLKIALATKERQHLILTGRNGSGKTSVLLALKAYLNSVETVMFLYQPNNNSILTFSDAENLVNNFKNKDFILAFFGVKRLSEFKKPVGPQKITTPTYVWENKLNAQFLQYLINLHYRKLNATVQKQFAEVQKIEDWFNNFTKSLKLIFGADKLELVYDFDDFNFNIVLPNREKFDLNTLKNKNPFTI